MVTRRRKRTRKRKQNGWIQKAIEHPGALRAYVKRYYGSAGFDSKGRIKATLLRQLAKRDDTIGKRARLALELRKFHRR